MPCRVLLPRHEEPRYHAYVDKETQQAAVTVIFQQEFLELKSPKDLKALITEELFLVALNNRLFRISRRPEPPFYAAAVRLPNSLCCKLTAKSCMLHEGIKALGFLRPWQLKCLGGSVIGCNKAP